MKLEEIFRRTSLSSLTCSFEHDIISRCSFHWNISTLFLMPFSLTQWKRTSVILGRKRKQKTLYSAIIMAAMLEPCITKHLLKHLFPVCKAHLSIPTCPVINHNVLLFCCFNPIKFTFFARLAKHDGRKCKSMTGARWKHSFPLSPRPITMVHSVTKNTNVFSPLQL